MGEIKLKNNLITRFTDLALGIIISGLGISLVIQSSLGSFCVTAANIMVSERFFLSYSIASMVVEAIMMLFALCFKVKPNIGTVANLIFGGIAVDLFNLIIPVQTVLPLQVLYALLGVIILSVGNYFNCKCGLGNSNSNACCLVIQRLTKRSAGFARNVLEIVFLLLGLFGSGVGILTFVLSVGYGTVMGYIYKLLNFDPDKVVQVEFKDIFKQQKIKELIIE